MIRHAIDLLASEEHTTFPVILRFLLGIMNSDNFDRIISALREKLSDFLKSCKTINDEVDGCTETSLLTTQSLIVGILKVAFTTRFDLFQLFISNISCNCLKDSLSCIAGTNGSLQGSDSVRDSVRATDFSDSARFISAHSSVLLSMGQDGDGSVAELSVMDLWVLLSCGQNTKLRSKIHTLVGKLIYADALTFAHLQVIVTFTYSSIIFSLYRYNHRPRRLFHLHHHHHHNYYDDDDYYDDDYY